MGREPSPMLDIRDSLCAVQATHQAEVEPEKLKHMGVST